MGLYNKRITLETDHLGLELSVQYIVQLRRLSVTVFSSMQRYQQCTGWDAYWEGMLRKGDGTFFVETPKEENQAYDFKK